MSEVHTLAANIVEANLAKEAGWLIEGNEGFQPDAKWDVTAWRLGYGSDTEGPEQVKVTKGMHTTRERAFQNLEARMPQFEAVIVKQVGQELWDKLTISTQAALLDMAYNYGDLPDNVAATIRKTSDLGMIAAAVEARRGDNHGVNKNRRDREARIILGQEKIPGASPSPQPVEAKAEVPQPQNIPAAALPKDGSAPHPLDVSNGDDLQRALNLLVPTEQPLVIDHVLGPKTIAAIRAFQEHYGLRVNGETSFNTGYTIREALIAKGIPVAPIT